jgi:hypothetical protein
METIKSMQIKERGAWFGPLRTIYIDSVHIKGIRSTGVDATSSSSVRTAERLAPGDDCHEGRAGNLLVYISVLEFCSVSRLCKDNYIESFILFVLIPNYIYIKKYI